MAQFLVFIVATLGANADSLARIELQDSAGRTQRIGALLDRPAIVFFFTGTDCPLGNLYLAEVLRLAARMDPKSVRFVVVNPNVGETPAVIAEHAREFSIPFPVLLDPRQILASRLGATRTPETFLLDGAGELRYRGRLDDRFGYAHRRDQPTRKDLECAIVELLADQPITVPRTDVVGCLIDRDVANAKDGPVTYAGEVVHILRDKCESCHRNGMVAPFSLSSYGDAVRWLGPIRESVEAERMPPWHADPAHGSFANDRRLTALEKKELLAWIDAGAPRGDVSKEPTPRTYAKGWMIGEPDVIFAMPREVKVPASGIVPYKYFTTRTRFAEDVWIRAAEIKPGNPAVVHHAIVFVRDPKDGMLDPTKLNDGFLVSSSPCDVPLNLPPGVARRIPAGSEIVWQVHYTPTGKEEVDRCELGLVFYRDSQPPRGDARTLAVLNRALRIPAGEANYEHHASYTFREDTTILSLCPHMHLRGKDFSITAVFPDRREEVLLVVPRFDVAWNTTYRLAKPLKVPKGTKIHCVAHFDNSAANRNNPDAAKDVLWGEQVWEEMMIGWIDYYTEQSVLTKQNGRTKR